MQLVLVGQVVRMRLVRLGVLARLHIPLPFPVLPVALSVPQALAVRVRMCVPAERYGRDGWDECRDSNDGWDVRRVPVAHGRRVGVAGVGVTGRCGCGEDVGICAHGVRVLEDEELCLRLRRGLGLSGRAYWRAGAGRGRWYG